MPPTLSPSADPVLFRDAARETLRSAFDKMMKNADNTRAGLEKREPTPSEVVALHDMRVGSRRLRAALSVFARVFTKSDYRGIEQEVAAITGALSAVRDLDTQRETLAAISAGMPENEAYGVERLRKRLAKQRDRERETLLKALSKLDKSRFEKRFAQTLARATGKAR
ncbi:MAG: CHAD domain-containing protein [Armatimonadetes bacterium]|nr:CHAD domain-containing protein [Armatimonadota bacterium]